MRIVISSLLDPLTERLALGIGERTVRVGWGHRFFRVCACHAQVKLAVPGVARYHCCVPSEVRVGPEGGVESQIRFSFRRVLTVAVKAVLGEDGANIEVKGQRVCLLG